MQIQMNNMNGEKISIRVDQKILEQVENFNTSAPSSVGLDRRETDKRKSCHKKEKHMER